MTMRRFIAFCGCVLLMAAAAFAQPADKPQKSQEELEKEFAETLTGATLLGRFTIVGMNDGKPLAEERYTLGKVHKIKDDLWSFQARVQYGGRDVKVPLALHVKWAGDTPVITLTDLAMPGLGTYTARVLFYGGQYVGTWSGRDHGGQMFGRVIKAGEEVPPMETKPEEKPAENAADAKPAAAE